MKLNNLPSEFQEALPVLKKIREAGYEAYFVGGSVRDALLNRPIHDVDIATSAYPEETKTIFARTIDIGIEHGTVLVLEDSGEYEITTFRTEDVYVDYRRHLLFGRDRKSTRLNSSHVSISYAVFCLKKKNSECDSGDILTHLARELE